MLDENHNRDSAHVLHNIIEFRVNIYAAQKMKPGGSWFPLSKRIQDTKAVINPKNKDDRCFLYAVYLGLLDLSKMPQHKSLTDKERSERPESDSQLFTAYAC